jgi:hypothetical protein
MRSGMPSGHPARLVGLNRVLEGEQARARHVLIVLHETVNAILDRVPQVGGLPVREGLTRRMDGLTCLCPHRSECRVRTTIWPTILTFYFTRPPRNYAFRERVAEKPAGATSAPAAPHPTTAPVAIPVRVAPQETTARAIAVLDARFPWLAG